jgi:hypothetical protein
MALIRLKYFWPILCGLLVVMVCYQGARIDNQEFRMERLKSDLDTANAINASLNSKFDMSNERAALYDSMLTDCQSAITQAADSLEKLNKQRLGVR